MKSYRHLAALCVGLLLSLTVSGCGYSTPTSPISSTGLSPTTQPSPAIISTTTLATNTTPTTATTAVVALSTASATTVAPTSASNFISTSINEAFAYGVASGDMTTDSVVLWTRTPTAASVTAEIAESQSFDNAMALPPVQSNTNSDFTVKVMATGLKPGTKYYYRFRANGAISPVGTFKTAYAPDQKASVTMAFTGDADWKWKPYPLLNSLNKENLDFFFFLGDLIYETTNLPGTTVAENLNDYRLKYRENREPRANSPSKMVPMRDLYRLFGQYSVFDNHETGGSKTDKNAPPYNEGGAQTNGQFVNQSEGFKARIEAYREYQPVRDEQVAGTGDTRSDQTYKFYRSISWGANVQMIVVDDRSYRDVRLISSDDPNAASCSRTMLGAPQLKWLEDELLAAKQRLVTWKVVVVSSPLQELGRASQLGSDMDGGKSWAGDYNCERNRILKFIDDNAIDNVVFLTTDNHYTIINNLKYNSVPEDLKSPLKSARNSFEILTGPIGAGAGNPSGLKVNTSGLNIRTADRKILQTWNGDIPNSDGQVKGLKQAGLDPIGLEADFPGLDVSSLKCKDVPAATVDPLCFASFNTYTYAVLSFSQSSLSVQVKGFPIVADPLTLLNSDAEKEYEARQVEEIFSFQVKAQ